MYKIHALLAKMCVHTKGENKKIDQVSVPIDFSALKLFWITGISLRPEMVNMEQKRVQSIKEDENYC